LLSVIFPELDELVHGQWGDGPSGVWNDTLQILQRLEQTSPATALAVVLRGLAVGNSGRPGVDLSDRAAVEVEQRGKRRDRLPDHA
jgi:hypothetical protein